MGDNLKDFVQGDLELSEIMLEEFNKVLNKLQGYLDSHKGEVKQSLKEKYLQFKKFVRLFEEAIDSTKYRETPPKKQEEKQSEDLLELKVEKEQPKTQGQEMVDFLQMDLEEEKISPQKENQISYDQRPTEQDKKDD